MEKKNGAREPFLLVMTMNRSAGVAREMVGVCCHPKDGLLTVGRAELQPVGGSVGSDWASLSTEERQAQAEWSLLS